MDTASDGVRHSMQGSRCRRRAVLLAALACLYGPACGSGDNGEPDADAGADAPDDAGDGNAADDAGDAGPDDAADDAGDAGPAPGPVVRLTDTPTDSETFLNTARCIAVDAAGTVHVVWLEVVVPGGGGHATQGQVFHARSTDGGATFSAPAPLTGVVADVGVPKVAAAGTSIFVTWHQSDGSRVRIRFVRSDDGGTTWTPTPTDLGQGTFPSLDAWWSGSGDPFVHVTWSDSQNAENHCEIFLASSTDGGSSFGAPVMVSEPDGLNSWTAAVASWDRTVHVAWTDERHNVDAAGLPYDCIVVGGGETCHEEEYYRRSLDGGATFPEPEVRLTSDPPAAPQWSWAPSIVAWHDDVHLAFFDHRTGSFEIHYLRSRDAGTTWEEQRSLTGGLPVTPLGRWRPSLAAIGDRLELAFWEPAPGGPTTAWTMGSFDGGSTWFGPQSLTDGVSPMHPASPPRPRAMAPPLPVRRATAQVPGRRGFYDILLRPSTTNRGLSRPPAPPARPGSAVESARLPGRPRSTSATRSTHAATRTPQVSSPGRDGDIVVGCGAERARRSRRRSSGPCSRRRAGTS